MLVISEFIGCSPSLSGAIRINPWNIELTAEAMNEAIAMNDVEKHVRHEKHYSYVSTHDVAYWSRSFMLDLERTCKDNFKKRCLGIGLGFGFRVVSLDPNFRKLNFDVIVSAYQRSKSHAILLDCDGTIISQMAINKTPSAEVISILNSLCADTKNVVFIVSGHGKDSLEKWFSHCRKLGIAAEHGYYMRWSPDEEWDACGQNLDFERMHKVEPIMKLYTESTNRRSIEKKESALVWHHQNADPDFGSAHSKEMLDHIDSVLVNELVSVKSRQFIVEVKSQSIHKGIVVEKIMSSMVGKNRLADFVLCIGDDRSDEDLLECISNSIAKDLVAPNTSVFACTVGQKPSKARYYLDDTVGVTSMLGALADSAEPHLCLLLIQSLPP